MRTYSHAILTYAATRGASRRETALAAGIGAAIPDAPMALGAAWLWARRKTFSRKDFDDEVCGRSLFRGPDAALHSAIPIAAAAIALGHIFRGKTSAFLLGWAGHVLADFLTHGEDARPIFWPLSEWKFESPISYRGKEQYGRLFTVVEHAAVMAALIFATAKRSY